MITTDNNIFDDTTEAEVYNRYYNWVTQHRHIYVPTITFWDHRSCPDESSTQADNQPDDILEKVAATAAKDDYFAFVCYEYHTPHLIVIDTKHWRECIAAELWDIEDAPSYIVDAIREYNRRNSLNCRDIFFIAFISFAMWSVTLAFTMFDVSLSSSTIILAIYVIPPVINVLLNKGLRLINPLPLPPPVAN